ncbi:MAG: TrkH family potassium uptake protein [Clostridiales bacterium]|nr:TrkH family potassium uptake protein [Clostridiales bacterium]
MNYKVMGKFISQILMVESAFMLPPFFISIFEGNLRVMFGFLVGICVALGTGMAMFWACRNTKMKLYAREGMACVALSWIAISFFGCIPFVVSGEIPNFLDALFEMVSGFTTTGATIVTDIEALSGATNYWRCFSQWLGGMGVLVFVLALSFGQERANGATIHLLRAESPGPNVGKLVPKMRTTARILYTIYIMLTAFDFMFLCFGDMSPFEALCSAFSTAGTGGYGLMNTSMAGHSAYTQVVCTVFMFLFGVNFSCFYLLLLGKIRTVLKDRELRLYVILVACSIVFIAINIRNLYAGLGETIRHSAFQVVSIITTTGFATCDFDQWPNFSKSILLALMFIGGCAGSTCGGLKCSRVLLLLKDLRRKMRKMVNPQRVEVVRFNFQPVSEDVLEGTQTYLVAYVAIVLVSFFLVALNGKSMMTSISAVATCFNNVGPGFEEVGASCNYAGLSVLSKIVLIFDMLAGRLEIFPMMLLFTRSMWRHR